MLAQILPLSALLTGIALLLSGQGLFNTLLALRGSAEGYGDALLGAVMACYFAGFLIGTYLGPPLIQRLGHIRSFAFCAALVAITALLHGLWQAAWFWALLRLVCGAALVTIYCVVESWLNAATPSAQRGRVFAIYMIVNLLALALGQQFIVVAPLGAFTLFALVAVLINLAVLPVTATRLTQPAVIEQPRTNLRRLWQAAPVAAAGAVFSGLAMGAFWTLGPTYATRSGLDAGGAALLMSLTILGGAVMQWPLGRHSDRHDRRKVILGTCLGAALFAAALTQSSTDTLMLAGMAVYGGFAFAIYPLAVAHLLDRLEPAEILSGTTGMLLMHGLSAALAPLLAGALMQQLGAWALPLYFGAMHLALAAFILMQSERFEMNISGPRTSFIPMLRTSPVVLKMMRLGKGASAAGNSNK